MHPLTGKKRDESFRLKARLRQLGKKPSKKNLEKLKIANTGRKKTQEELRKSREAKLGKKNPMYGKKPSKEHRLRISESLKKTKARTRDLVFQEVIHAIRNSPQYKMWREEVFARDKFTCLWCLDAKGGNLEADHIKPFMLIIKQHEVKTVAEAMMCKELWEIANGRTLCKRCHKTTDTWGAKAKLLWS